MTFTQFLSILRARSWVVLLVLGLTVGTTVAVSLFLPKQFEATARVVLDFKPDPVSAAIFGGMAPPAVMATQVDIINSERVAQRVVRNLRLGENPQVRQQWLDETGGQGSIETWLGGLFQRQMKVTPSRESSVIAITYRSPRPEFAAQLANAFVQAYIDTALELRVDPARQYSAFFETRAKEARDSLEAAQARLSAFQKENGIIATDERLDIETARLNELSSQLTQLQAIAAESAIRQAQARGTDMERLDQVMNNPVVAGLRAEINRSEAALQQISTRLGDAHPQVREANANLAEMRSRLEAETRKVAGSVGITSTINRARETEVARQLAQQRTNVLRMKAVRDEGVVLIREVENAQRTYDAILQRFTQTTLEGQTTQSAVNVLTQAVAPLQHSSPNVMLNTVLAVFLGGLLAVGTALLLELMDRRVRNVDDVVDALGLPVLGVMPKPGAKLHLGGNRRSLLQQRLLAPLPAPATAAKGA
jgi:polysaccharide biosynthesis transport protein